MREGINTTSPPDAFNEHFQHVTLFTANRVTVAALRLTVALMVCSLFLASIPSDTDAAYRVHYFDCKNCHFTGLTQDQIVNGFVCLKCHDTSGTDIAPPSGSWPDGLHDGHTEYRFEGGDSSNLYGSNPAPDRNTSHNWNYPTDTRPEAGAHDPEPVGAARYFYTRYGSSLDKVTCSRCHLPHATTDNPQLLTMGPGSADQMCLACHAQWNQKDNHGWLTHPVGVTYNTTVVTAPGKYRSSIVNKENADIQLINGQVSCTSCHGVHYVDSDASTADGPANHAGLLASEGRLLRGDGSERADKSSLCQSCHTYPKHGDSTGEKVGCLVCHSGHSYDPEYPNYFVLRKSATTSAYNTVTGLNYSDPDVLIDASKYTFWNDQTDGTATGYCERCHGDAKEIGFGAGDYHVAAAICTDCHSHASSFGHGDGSYGSSCLECHDTDHLVNENQKDWITFFANGADHTWDAGYPIDTYATCSMCHITDLLPQHASNCDLCHAGASPARDSFADWNQTCQQGSCHPGYHSLASSGHDSQYNLNNCNRCHNSGYEGWSNDYAWDYIARADFCSECHGLRPDDIPPVSQSDLQGAYIDSAVITIWASDPYGIQAIYYRLDGGTAQTYSGPITVPSPASGTESHTLEYWAKDTSNNIEASHIGSFTVSKDTTPPVTTSNARSLYGADAIIQLTASDDATSHGVAMTYYKDGVDGTIQTGTTAVIPEPASGSEEHTLYFWSVDHAGNIEDPPNQATFTIIAGGQEHTALHLDQTVGFYTEPDASGPRISYKIYIDDVLKKTITKNTAGSSHISWNCPETPVSPGSHIDVVVDAWFTNYTGTPGGNAPHTFTLDLPDDAVRLEAATWDIEMNMAWASVEYEPGYGDFAYVEALPAVIENIVYLTTSPDTTKPVTTSNVTSGYVYGGNQTFTLSASDTGTGVESTWWQLDSTTGSWTKGQTVPVTEPAEGTTEAHTLYWYSQDHAGNLETVKSVSFSVENLRTFTTSLPLDQAGLV